MWKKHMINEIKKTKFNLDTIFIHPITNQCINRDEYIDLVINDFLELQKNYIESLNGLEILESLESRINHNIKYITLRYAKVNEFNCDEVLGRLILTYIYWKYKHPSSSNKSRFDMANIKKMFGFKSKFEILINPIKCNTKCYICGGNATLSIPSYSKNRILFFCNNCSHSYQTGADGTYSNEHLKNQYLKCSCKLCNSIKTELHQKGIEWFNNLEKIIDNMDEYIDAPNDGFLKNAYNIYYNSKGDGHINEILEYSPSSLGELLDIIKAISNTLGDNYYEVMINKFKRFNILFDVKRKINLNINKSNIILRYLLESCFVNYITNENFDKLKNYILSGEFIEYYDFDKCLVNESTYARMDYNFTPNLSQRYNILSDIDINKLRDLMYEKSLFVNPYFLKKNNNSKENLITEINNLISDCSEYNLNIILETIKAIKKIENN